MHKIIPLLYYITVIFQLRKKKLRELLPALGTKGGFVGVLFQVELSWKVTEHARLWRTGVEHKETVMTQERIRTEV